MKNYLRIFFPVMMIFSSYESQAQEPPTFSLSSSIWSPGVGTATDYQALGINPANLGFGKLKPAFAFSVMDQRATLSSDALSLGDLQKFVYSENNFTPAQQQEYALNFLNKGLDMSATFSPVSLWFHIPKLGGFGLSWKEKIAAGFALNPFASHLMFEGFHYQNYFDTFFVNTQGDTAAVINPDSAQSIGTLFDGTKIQFSWTRELTFGYGTKIVSNDMFSLYAGLDLKLLYGFAMVDAQFSPESTYGYASMMSLLIPEDFTSYHSPTQTLTPGIKPVGHGFGGDAGLTLTVAKGAIRLGASVTDLGQMKWEGNVIQFSNQKLDTIYFPGFSTLSSNDIFLQMLEKNSPLAWTGSQEQIVNLPSAMHLGVGARISRTFEAGFDLNAPLTDNPGAINKISYSANLAVNMKVLVLSTGIAGREDNPSFTVPVGLSIMLAPRGIVQMGIFTGDVLSFVTEQASHTLSAGLCTLRVQF